MRASKTKVYAVALISRITGGARPTRQGYKSPEELVQCQTVLNFTSPPPETEGVLTIMCRISAKISGVLKISYHVHMLLQRGMWPY